MPDTTGDWTASLLDGKYFSSYSILNDTREYFDIRENVVLHVPPPRTPARSSPPPAAARVSSN